MNKLMVIFITTLILSVATTAIAQPRNPPMDRRAGHPPRGMQNGMPEVDHLMHALKQLDLSDVQKSGIKDIMRSLKTEISPIMEQSRAGREQLKELIKAENYDEKAVAKLAKTEGGLASQRIVIASRALSKVFAKLTPAQRDQIESMAEEFKAKRQERRATKRMEKRTQ